MISALLQERCKASLDVLEWVLDVSGARKLLNACRPREADSLYNSYWKNWKKTITNIHGNDISINSC